MRTTPPIRPTRALLATALLATVVLAAPPAQAQRTQGTLFVSPHVGVSSYVGDNSGTLLPFEGGFPYRVGLEAGYQLPSSGRWSMAYPTSVSAGYHIGRYSGIDGADDIRQTAELLVRSAIGSGQGELVPYLTLGAHTSLGRVPNPATGERERSLSAGPVLGLGLDVAATDRVSFFLEGTSRLAAGDKASPGLDFLNSAGTGLRVNLRSGAQRLAVQSVYVPEALRTGELGAFRAVTNEAQTAGRTEYRWDFGDGTEGAGLTTTHAFSSPGTYRVTLNAHNRGRTETRTTYVVVEPAAELSLHVGPTTPENADGAVQTD